MFHNYGNSGQFSGKFRFLNLIVCHSPSRWAI